MTPIQVLLHAAGLFKEFLATLAFLLLGSVAASGAAGTVFWVGFSLTEGAPARATGFTVPFSLFFILTGTLSIVLTCMKTLDKFFDPPKQR